MGAWERTRQPLCQLGNDWQNHNTEYQVLQKMPLSLKCICDEGSQKGMELLQPLVRQDGL